MLATTRVFTRLIAVVGLTLGLVGCSQSPRAVTAPTVDPAPSAPAPVDEVTAERAKLSPEDRALVDAQEWCVISTDERLGAMGPPLKLMIKGQPVFVCCKGCKRKAEADPDKTLAAVAELKAKAKAQPTPASP
jgi:hypothetical protein